MGGSALGSMRIPILLSVFVGKSMASSSTPLLGWQLDGNSRSAWDILWTCLSTIFACTWTLLHMDVPPRNMSVARSTSIKLRVWVRTILAPEVTFLQATGQLADAKKLRKSCRKCAIRHRKHETRNHQSQNCGYRNGLGRLNKSKTWITWIYIQSTRNGRSVNASVSSLADSCCRRRINGSTKYSPAT